MILLGLYYLKYYDVWRGKIKKEAAAAVGQKGRVCGPNRRIGIPNPLDVAAC